MTIWRSTRHDWTTALRRCLTDLRTGTITDRAAALTYYGILSIFPGLLVLVSVLGILGGPATGLNDVIGSVAPGQAGEFMQNAVNQVSGSTGRAGIAAAAGLIVAFWSSSGYVAAFMRAVDAVSERQEHRKATRTIPVRLALTAAVGLLIIACVFLLVVTGGVARRVGQVIGLGSAAVTAWNIAKWPVLLLLVILVVALLYRGALARPRGQSVQARHVGTWVTPGSVTAVLLWLVISALFGVYLATFASYQKTYGALASVIIFLIWLWLTNISVLIGADLDAGLERSHNHPEGGSEVGQTGPSGRSER